MIANEYNDQKDNNVISNAVCSSQEHDKDSQSPSCSLQQISNISQNNTSISKIPRYIRNNTMGDSSNSNSRVASNISSPVQRKLLTKQHQNQRYTRRDVNPDAVIINGNHLFQGIVLLKYLEYFTNLFTLVVHYMAN